MNLKRHLSALVAAVLLGSGLAGCAVEDERPVPYEPQVTHTPKSKNTDDTGVDQGGLDDDDIDVDGAGEDGANESRSDAEALEPPVIPDAIYEETLEGAEAAALYYVDAYLYGIAELDPKPLEFICQERSQSCMGHIENIKTTQAEGRYIKGGEVIVNHTEDLYAVDGGAMVELDVIHDPTYLYDENGEQLGSSEGNATVMMFLAEFNDAHWTLRAISPK